MFDQYFEKFDLAPEVAAALKKCKCIAYAETKAELEEMAYGPTHTSRYDVVYPIEGKGTVKEAEVVRCKNGCVVNFMEDYMRRRDPNSMAIGDDLPPTSRALRIASAMSFRPFVRRRSTGSRRSRSSCCRFPPVRAATVIRA